MSDHDTPVELRGYRYNTHMTLRCASFNKCSVCSMCTRFDRHNAICVMCESRKMDGTKCICTNQKRFLIGRVIEKMRAPMFAPPGFTNIPIKPQGLVEDKDWRDLSEAIDQEFTGVGVNNVRPTMVDTGESYFVPDSRDVQ